MRRSPAAEHLTGPTGFDDDAADASVAVAFIAQTVPESAEPLFAAAQKCGELAALDVDVSGRPGAGSRSR